MLRKIDKIKGTALPLRGDDIDTDRIIPARFLISTTFDGLGENVFCDERFSHDGKETNHPMNNKNYSGANIIITNSNFGCGSSREHAPQAIKRAGFDLIVAESFAEIFYGNSSVLGLVCVTLPKDQIEQLLDDCQEHYSSELSIDISKSELIFNDKVYNISIKEELKKSLLNGSYDTIAELESNKEIITEFEKALPY